VALELCRSPDFTNFYWLNEHVCQLGLHVTGGFLSFIQANQGLYSQMVVVRTLVKQRGYVAITYVVNLVINLRHTFACRMIIIASLIADCCLPTLTFTNSLLALLKHKIYIYSMWPYVIVNVTYPTTQTESKHLLCHFCPTTDLCCFNFSRLLHHGHVIVRKISVK